MEKVFLIFLLRCAIVTSSRDKISVKETVDENESDLNISFSNRGYHYVPPLFKPVYQTTEYANALNPLTTSVLSPAAITPYPTPNLENYIDSNPLLAAYLLSNSLGIQDKLPGYNHPQHLPLNPYLALLFSHYGKYIPVHGTGRGIYSYIAANNYHNNKPFGAYKIYKDLDV